MAKDLEKMNVIELRQEALELKKRLAHMRFEKATGKLIDTSAPSKIKRQLARVLTKETQLAAR